VSIRQLSFALLTFFCPATTATLSAQQPPQPAQPTAEDSSSVRVLRINTHLVQVNVIVNDKHGNPIPGLSEKDFSILDDGKRQEIRVFSAETNRPSPPELPFRQTPTPTALRNKPTFRPASP